MTKKIVVESIHRLQKRYFNFENAKRNLRRVAREFSQSDKPRLLQIPSADKKVVIDFHNEYTDLKEDEFAAKLASLEGNVIDSVYTDLEKDVFKEPWEPLSLEIEVGNRHSKDGLLSLLAAFRTRATALWIPTNPVLIHKWKYMVPKTLLSRNDKVIVSPVGRMSIAVYSQHHRRGTYLSIGTVATLYDLKEAIAAEFDIDFESQHLIIKDLDEVRKSDNINDSYWYGYPLLRLGISPRDGLSVTLEDAQVLVAIKAATDYKMKTSTVRMDADGSAESGIRDLSLDSDIQQYGGKKPEYPKDNSNQDPKDDNNHGGNSSRGPHDCNDLNNIEDEELGNLLRVKPQRQLSKSKGSLYSLKVTEVKSLIKCKSSNDKKSSSSSLGPRVKRKTSSSLVRHVKRKRCEVEDPHTIMFWEL